MLRLLKWSCAFSTKLRRSTSCGTCTTTKKRHFSHFAAFRGGHMTGVANLSKMPSFLTKVFCIPFRTAYAMAALRFARKVGMKIYFYDPLQGGVVSANCKLCHRKACATSRLSDVVSCVFFKALATIRTPHAVVLLHFTAQILFHSGPFKRTWKRRRNEGQTCFFQPSPKQNVILGVW